MRAEAGETGAKMQHLVCAHANCGHSGGEIDLRDCAVAARRNREARRAWQLSC